MRSGAEEYEAHRRALSREYVRRNPHLAVRKLSLLSEKEYLSLKGVCAGQPIQQIAKSLNVEVHTIHIYLRRACKKMEAQDRAQAIEMAVTEGILEN